jgi:hypothetical protein
MILNIFDDGRMAKIIIDSTSRAISADELVRMLLSRNITGAKIIRIQTAKEIPPPRFDQEGGGQSHHKGGQYGQR